LNRQLFNPTKLYPQQKILLGSPDNSVIVAKGGAGTAKTTGGVLKLYEYLSRYPGAYILVIMQTLNQLRMVFKETWESIAPEKHYKYSDMGNTITLYNGAKISLQYGELPSAVDRVRGVNLSGYYIIQAESLTNEKLIYELDQRVRIQGIPHLRLIDSNGGHLHRVCSRRYSNFDSAEFIATDIKKTESGPLTVYRGKCAFGNYLYIHIKTTPETSVYTKEVLDENKRTMPEATYKRMILGLDTADEGLVYDEFDRHVHVKEFEINEGWKFYRGIDFGYTNPFVCLWIGIDADGNYFVFDEWYMSKLLVPEHVTAIKGRWDNLEYLCTYADPSGGAMLGQLMDDLGGNIEGGYNNRQWGRERVKMNFKQDKITIHPRCENLIYELQVNEWKTLKSGNEVPEDSQKVNDHALDALRYVIASLEI